MVSPCTRAVAAGRPEGWVRRHSSMETTSIHASAGDDLRTFFDGVVDKFTETRFRVLQLPDAMI